MEKKIVKEYEKDGLTIVWEPAKCIHAGVCVRMLPQVYDPKAKPWVDVNKATVEELKAQISKCPSGALSYRSLEQPLHQGSSMDTRVKVMQNGPLLVHGKIEVTYMDGHSETRDQVTAFCRCGQSEKKPYCDGTHKNIDFVG